MKDLIYISMNFSLIPCFQDSFHLKENKDYLKVSMKISGKEISKKKTNNKKYAYSLANMIYCGG